GVIHARGLLRHETDRAALGVTTLEGTLRSAQHFDALDVKQVEIRTRQAWIVDIIDVQTDARLEGGIEVSLAEAADVGGDRIAEGRRLLAKHHAGRCVQDIGELLRTLLLDLLGSDRSDRDRYVLQLLLAILRGDDDLLERRDRLHRGSSICRQDESAA